MVYLGLPIKNRPFSMAMLNNKRVLFKKSVIFLRKPLILHIAHDYPRLPVVWEKSSQAMDICDPRLDHNQLDDIPRKEGSNSCNIYVTLMKSTDPHLAGNHYISMGFFWIATANSDVHHGTTSFLKRRRIFCLSASGFKSSTSLHELCALAAMVQR